MPNSSRSDGINIADSTPPALKSNHRYGSECCLTIYAPSKSQHTTADTPAKPA